MVRRRRDVERVEVRGVRGETVKEGKEEGKRCRKVGIVGPLSWWPLRSPGQVWSLVDPPQEGPYPHLSTETSTSKTRCFYRNPGGSEMRTRSSIFLVSSTNPLDNRGRSCLFPCQRDTGLDCVKMVGRTCPKRVINLGERRLGHLKWGCLSFSV